MLEIVVLIIASLLNGLLGLVVYSKNPRGATNRLFAVLCFSFILWSCTDYLSLHPILISQLLWVRLVLCTAVFLCLSAYLMLTTFPSNTLQGRLRPKVILTGWCVVVMVLTLTPIIFQKLVGQGSQVSPEPGPGIPLFLLTVVGLLGSGIWNLVSRYKKSRGSQRAQLGLVLFGLAGAFVLILFTNLFFVLAFHSSALVSFGSACTLVFSSSLYYAIARRRLFDIRATTARFVAFILSMSFIGGAYGVLIFVVASIIPAESINLQRLVYVGFLLVSAMLYPNVRQFFAKITNRVLYQDAYDSPELFNELNKVLVASTDLDKLLTQVLTIVGETLKTDFSAIVLAPTEHERWRAISVPHRNLPLREIVLAYQSSSFSKNPSQVVATDLLLDDSHTELTKVLLKNDIAVLASIGGGSQKQLGHIMLGPKKSGRLYDDQDISAIESISNELVIAIENALRFEQIQNFNLTLQEEIANATRKLRNSNRRLQDLDEIKDDFISMASHQLRTPLTAIKGYLSMVLDGDAGKLNETETDMLKQAFASSQRMVFLITDLLNVSRLKTGKFVIDAAPTNLADVVDEELEQLHETAQVKQVKLEYQKPKAFPLLMLDDVKVRQVIMNFVDNAVYYTPSGGTIRIELTDTPTAVELRVIDNGIGVPRSEQHHLFTKFYRATNARKARPDGTGLGLFMAQKVVIAHHGTVIFSSAEGKGSTFGFSFPKSKLRVPDAPKAASQPVGVDK